jgi:predicted adenine nucleotide alpha hydrolase (AANH) superfamily ATPase
MKLDGKAYNILYRIRKSGVKIDTRKRTVYFDYDGKGSTPSERMMKEKPVERLCKEYRFYRQAIIN